MNRFCRVAPSPDLAAKIREIQKAQGVSEFTTMSSAVGMAEELGLPVHDPSRIGFNDGVFYPPTGAEGLEMTAAISGVSPASTPTTAGRKHVLVILADFPDLSGSRPASHFEQLLFQQEPNLRSYYRDASSGQLDVTGEVVGWIRLPQPLAHYANRQSGLGNYPRNGQRLVEDALDAAVAQGLNLAPFDVDGDGSLDGLIVVQAGDGAEAELDDQRRKDLIWSHKWVLTSPRTLNGVKVYPYTLQPSNGRLGVFCHEFGHFLGLPDLYDTSNRSSGVGEWCLMGSGSWLGGGDQPGDMSAWCRSRLGWVAPSDLRGTHQGLQVTPGQVLRIKPDNAGPREYFLLETRRRDGLDQDLPGEGLLIWHVDDGVNGNSNPRHYQVGLVQADGNQDLEFQQNRGDAGDPYQGSTGNDQFDRTSNPAATTHLGQPSNVELTNIQFAQGVTDCDVSAP